MRTPFRDKAFTRNPRVLLVALLMVSWVFSGWPRIFGFPPAIRLARAAASVTAATGGSAINADTTGGSYTTLTGPTITEGASGDIASSGTIVLTAPSGFVYNTGATVTATITKDSGSKTCFTFTSTTATPTATTITFTSSTKDGSGTKCHVTFSNIQVRPSSGTPLASGNITQTGTNAGAPSGATNYGTLTEVAGAKNRLAVTTQPSSTATTGVDFATKPVVTLQDQFGNTETADNSSTITEAVVLSSQSCVGTPGNGTLSSTPASGAAVSNGVLSYTAMQYSAAEDIKICFSSSGVTSALSNTVSVSSATVSVTVGDGVIAYGYIAAGGSKSTSTGMWDTQTATNTGNVAEDFSIQGTNSADWTLAASAGSEQYVHAFCTASCTSAPTNYTALTTSGTPLATNVAVGGAQAFDLNITVPTSTSHYGSENVDITILATQH